MFTRTGDDGNTNVINKRVGKDSPLVNMLGDLDEVNSFLGLALAKLPWDDMKKDIEKIQYELFAIGEELSTGNIKITQENVKWLEERTVAYRKESGPVKLFVIPGGSEEASYLHVARSVVRQHSPKEELPTCKICGEPTSYGREICKNCELMIQSGLLPQKYLRIS
jgi:ATP:cob(I)alamin adenosyltransferase